MMQHESPGVPRLVSGAGISVGAAVVVSGVATGRILDGGIVDELVVWMLELSVCYTVSLGFGCLKL